MGLANAAYNVTIGTKQALSPVTCADLQSLSDAVTATFTFQTGITRPSAANTGVSSSVTLSDWNSATGVQVVLTDGQVFTGRRIYGDLKPPSTHNTDIILMDCEIHGGTQNPTNQSAAVNCTGSRSGTGRVILINCTFVLDNKVDGRDCITGYKFEVYRCDVSGGVDGIGIFPAGSATSASVKVKGCYIHDMTYQAPETVGTHSDNQTHNDGIQIQGGTDIEIIGNYIVGSLGTVIGTPPSGSASRVAAGYCSNGIIIQNNTQPLDSTVIVDSNWITQAIHQLDLHTSSGPVQVSNNRLYVDYWSAGSSAAHINLYAGTAAVLTNNTWADGPNVGAVLTTGNGGVVNTAAG